MDLPDDRRGGFVPLLDILQCLDLLGNVSSVRIDPFKAQRPFHGDFPVSESVVGEDLRLFRLLEFQEGVADPGNVLFGQLTVLLAQVLAQWLEPLRGVDELHLSLAMVRLAVGDDPYVGGNAGVVEHVERQGHDRLQPVVFDDPAPDVAFPLASVAGEEGRAVVDLGDAAAQLCAVLHL